MLVDAQHGGSARWYVDVFGGRHIGAKLKSGLFYPCRCHLLNQ
jgi:hypothetical protein